MQNGEDEDVPSRAGLLLYQPLVHAWWILRHFQQRPCAGIVMAVFWQALLSLFSPNCVSTLVTQTLVRVSPRRVFYFATDTWTECREDQLPRGFLASCLWLMPCSSSLEKHALFERGPDRFLSTRTGLRRHMWQTCTWLLTGLCRRQRPLSTQSIVGKPPQLWTSASAVAASLSARDYDVAQVCGGVAVAHWRHADFLRLVSAKQCRLLSDPTVAW
jgi:hypothetical protein